MAHLCERHWDSTIREDVICLLLLGRRGCNSIRGWSTNTTKTLLLLLLLLLLLDLSGGEESIVTKDMQLLQLTGLIMRPRLEHPIHRQRVQTRQGHRLDAPAMPCKRSHHICQLLTRLEVQPLEIHRQQPTTRPTGQGNKRLETNPLTGSDR